MSHWKSYELPEPVELKAGEVYMMGFEDEVPFVRSASWEERTQAPSAAYSDLIGVPVRDPNRVFVVPQRDMTATSLIRATYSPGLWAIGGANS